MLKRLLEQQKAICWHNKIRKAAAVLSSSHKNLIVSLKLRPLWKAALKGAKGYVELMQCVNWMLKVGGRTDHP